MKFDEILRDIGEFGWYQKRVYFLAVLPCMFIGFETFSAVFIFFIPEHRCALPDYAGDSFIAHNDSHALHIKSHVPLNNGRWANCHVFSDGFGHDIVLTDNTSSNGDVTNGVESPIPYFVRDNHTEPPSFITSSSQSACNRWVYDRSVLENTIATELDLVCDKSWHRSISNMISEIGTLTGVLVSGFIADRFGRKIPFYIGGFALIGGGFGAYFSTSIVTINMCRFVLGIARMSLFNNGLVIGMEIVGPSKRTFTGMFVQLVWASGEFILLLAAYLMRDWRKLELANACASLVILPFWWLLPESPRWLLSRGREDEALKVLERIAKSNNTQMPKISDVKQLLGGDDGLSFKQNFQSRELLLRILILFGNMMAVAMLYYGLALNVGNLTGNLFTNFAISTTLGTLGFLFPMFALARWGRKPVYCISMLVASAACIVSVFPVVAGAPEWVVVTLAMVGRFCVCSAYGVIYLYGAELFPTVVRASTMGVGVTFSRIGGIISPYIADVGLLVGGKYAPALPLIVMGTPAFLIAIVSLWLPETKGCVLPDTMKDLTESQLKGGFCRKKPRDEGEEIIVPPPTEVVVNAQVTSEC